MKRYVPLGVACLLVLWILGVTAYNSVYQMAHAQGEAATDSGVPVVPPPPPASASASVPGPSSEAVAAAPTSSTTARPEPTVDEADRLWRGGSMLGVSALLLYLALTLLMRVDKKRAFYWTSSATAVGLVVDSVRLGITPTAPMMMTSLGMLVAILVRGPQGKSELAEQPEIPKAVATPAPRDPQGGFARVALVACLSGVFLTAGLLFMAQNQGCAVPKPVKTAASAAVDCAVGETPQITAQLAALADAAIRHATGADGKVDPEPLKAATRGAVSDTAACVFAEAFARALNHPPAPVGAPQVAPHLTASSELRAVFEIIRAENLGGRSFKTAYGPL